MQIDYHDIGKRIRAARQKRNLTQEQLATMVDLGTTHISHIETGNTIPSMRTFVAIVNALDVSADELLCGSLANAGSVYAQEAGSLLADCTPDEQRVINETMQALKQAMRKNKAAE